MTPQWLEVIDSDTSESQVINNNTSETEVINNDTIKTEVINSDTTEAEVIDSDTTEAEVINSDMTETEVINIEVILPFQAAGLFADSAGGPMLLSVPGLYSASCTLQWPSQSITESPDLWLVSFSLSFLNMHVIIFVVISFLKVFQICFQGWEWCVCVGGGWGGGGICILIIHMPWYISNLFCFYAQSTIMVISEQCVHMVHI